MYILNDAVVVAIAAVYITFIRCMYACGELIINFRLIRPRLILHLLLSHMALPVDELKNSKKKAFNNCERQPSKLPQGGNFCNVNLALGLSLG